MFTLLILGAAVWAIYGRAVDAPFIFDDVLSVVNNTSIVRLWPLVGDENHRGPLNPLKELPTSGRPLVNLSFALNYHFGQLDPSGYHVFNLFVHLLSALLLAMIVERTLKLAYFAGRFDRAAWPLSVLVALVWALHPLQTETVVYVTQRTELLVGFFYLATLYCSIRYWAAASTRQQTLWLAFAVLVCAAGMTCKEVMVTAPLVVLLYERTFIAGSFREVGRRSGPLYLGLAASWILLLGINYDGPRARSAGFGHDVAAYSWWLTQAKVLSIYLRLVLWPWPLLIHYELPYLTTFADAWPWVLLVALLAAVSFALLRRNSAAGFLAAAMWLILSPTLIVPITTEVAAERRMYLPLAAAVSLILVGGYALVQRTERPLAVSKGLTRPFRWPTAVAASVTLALIVVICRLNVRRLSTYASPKMLWEDLLARQPDDPTAHNNLGGALLIDGKTQEAMGHFQQAIQIDPHFAPAYNNLGSVLVDAGRPQDAIAYLEKGAQLRPDRADTQFNFGKALVNLGRPHEAIEHFQQALQSQPDYPGARNNLGTALIEAGRLEEGVEQLRLAIERRPDDANAHSNLAMALLKMNRPAEAIEQCRQTIAIDPNHVQAWANSALANVQLGQMETAIAAGHEALRLARNQGQTAMAQQLEAWLATLHEDK